MTSTSTLKNIQTNTSLQTKQKSTIKPDKPLTSVIFAFQNNAINDGIFFSDELQLNNWLPPSVNQRLRTKEQEKILKNYSNKQTTNNTLINIREQSNLNQNYQSNYQSNYEQNAQEYKETK